ncbi:MAG: hypothetical protein AAF587_03335 [Bacteroidota bacterium]
MVYLTLGDRYSGVIASQVLDVAAFLQEELGEKVLVIAFISIRQFFQQRARFKHRGQRVWVVPMAPGLHRWRLNKWLMKILILLSGEKKAICRGVLATNLALTLKESGTLQQLIYDGRGATQAEWKEYEVVRSPQLIQEIGALEGRAILDTDWRIAVSQALVDHWQEEFGYQKHAHSIIPCTVNQLFLADLPSVSKRLEKRLSYGFDKQAVVLIYAGSSAGWQSFQRMDRWLLELMDQQAAIHILFLAKIELEQLACYRAYPKRVAKDWVRHEDMLLTLSIGDYGLLVREDSVTNQVASPTKFAEYLCGGLQVLISPKLGDYSAMVAQEELGHVVQLEQFDMPVLPQPTEEQKQQLHLIGTSRYSKQSYQSAYEQVLQPSSEQTLAQS